MALLLECLREAGAHDQAAELATRLPATGLFAAHPECGCQRYQFGREPRRQPRPAMGLTRASRQGHLRAHAQRCAVRSALLPVA